MGERLLIMGDIGEMNQQALNIHSTMNTERPSNNRENNFAVLRLVAALMVIAGHMSHLLATSVPTLFDRPIHSLGVYVFFLIGGYLISKSWLSDPHPLRYAVKRFMRIWPPLAMFVLCATFLVGPLLSWLPAGEYYAHPRTWDYLANLRLDIRYALPGVFDQNPYPHAVNGSLWTLPVEVLMYVLVPILLTICRAQTHTSYPRWVLLGMCTAICALVCYQNTYHPQARVVIYGTDWISALQIIPFYLIGMVCSLFDIRRYLSVQVSLVLILVLSCIKLSYVKMQIVLFLALPYIVFSIALAPNPFFFKMGKKAEISYGLYLWGFFIQQIVVKVAQQKGISLSYMQAFVISCALTTLVAYLSCYFVEKPVQRLTKRIISSISSSKKNGL